MYARKHAWNDGEAATTRGARLDAKKPHLFSVQRDQLHLAPPTLGLHSTHFLRAQYSSTPPPLFVANKSAISPFLGGYDSFIESKCLLL